MVYLLLCLSPAKYWQNTWNHVINRAGNYWIPPVAVDFSGERKRDERAPYWFHSIAEAQAHPDLAGLTWVWLASDGAIYLDEYIHPEDNVIYCIGCDGVGFDGQMGDGPRIKLRPMREQIPDNAEHPAALVADHVLFDRFMFLKGKRV